MEFKYSTKLRIVFMIVLVLDTFLLCTNVTGEMQPPSQDLTAISPDSTALLDDGSLVETKPTGSSDPVGNKSNEPIDYPDHMSDNDGDLWSIFFKLAAGLSAVVLLAWGSARLLKKSVLGRKFGVDNQLIKVVERTYLGSKTAIFLVEISGRTFALGVTDEAVSKIAEWKNSEIDLPDLPISAGFASQLKGILNPGPDGVK